MLQAIYKSVRENDCLHFILFSLSATQEPLCTSIFSTKFQILLVTLTLPQISSAKCFDTLGILYNQFHLQPKFFVFFLNTYMWATFLFIPFKTIFQFHQPKLKCFFHMNKILTLYTESFSDVVNIISQDTHP